MLRVVILVAFSSTAGQSCQRPHCHANRLSHVPLKIPVIVGVTLLSSYDLRRPPHPSPLSLGEGDGDAIKELLPFLFIESYFGTLGLRHLCLGIPIIHQYSCRLMCVAHATSCNKFNDTMRCTIATAAIVPALTFMYCRLERCLPLTIL